MEEKKSYNMTQMITEQAKLAGGKASEILKACDYGLSTALVVSSGKCDIKTAREKLIDAGGKVRTALEALGGQKIWAAL